MSEEPTRVREQPAPAPKPARSPLTPRSWISLVLATACGFLLGALVITTVGGTDTVTRTETLRVTVPATSTSGGTVITKTLVPQMIGEPLNVAKERAKRSQFAITIDSGGGVFGVIQDDNWEVVAQRPDPGQLLEQGSTLHVDIVKR